MFEEMLNNRFTCLCGRVHQNKAIKEWIVEEGAVYKLYRLIKNNYANALFVYDENTFAYSSEVENTMQGYHYNFVFKRPAGSSLLSDEKAVGELLIAAASAGLIVAVGSGTINDLCRFVSFRTKIPYFSIPTAPSIDGYASPMSSIIVNNLRAVYNCVPPAAVIADINLIKMAPLQMTAAGAGDLIGKNTCLCDWRLSNIVENEYFCSKVESLVRDSIFKCFNKLESIQRREPEGIAVLMEGLMFSGIAMSYVGNSRPASGSEHHIAHFWEMVFLFEGKPSMLHGLGVGLATLIIVRLYELLKEAEIDWESAYERAGKRQFSDYEEKIRKVYKNAADSIVLRELETWTDSPERTVARLNKCKENWHRVMEVIEVNIPEYAFVSDTIKFVGGVTSPGDLGIDRELFRNSILYAKESRKRYTVLQLISDLGLLEAFADRLEGEFYTD